MAYEMVMPYHLHMPSYFLETFTEYPNTVEELRTSAFVKELLADIHAIRYTFWRYPHWRLWQFLASAGK